MMITPYNQTQQKSPLQMMTEMMQMQMMMKMMTQMMKSFEESMASTGGSSAGSDPYGGMSLVNEYQEDIYTASGEYAGSKVGQSVSYYA